MLTFVVDDASFDQDWLFSVELLVRFPGLDQLCGICPPDPVSNEGTILTLSFYRSSQIKAGKQDVSIISEVCDLIGSDSDSHFGVSQYTIWT